MLMDKGLHFLVSLCLLAACATRCDANAAGAQVPIILISVDTLRSDHIGAYTPGFRETPQIDRFATRGTVWSQISSLVPLTLPSHVSIFTSTYPFTNGVRDNGTPLGPGATTLSSVLQMAGYRTAAFVGGFVLDRRFGLNKGFDVYESPFDLHRKVVSDSGALKIPASQVIASATRWIEKNKTAAFFVFIHLYDLHTPYRLENRSVESSGTRGYNAELSYVDGELGELFKYLEGNSLLNRCLIVFTADHGESLGDHGESTHGYFIYQSTLHVPLIIKWPSGFKSAPKSRMDQPGSLIDLAPTILDVVGVRAPKQMQGRDLLVTNSPEALYSESLYARNQFNFASLRSIRLGKYKYIEAPKPELYDLDTDPSELHNIYTEQKQTASALGKQLGLLSQGGKSAVTPSLYQGETTAALRSLGYLAAPSRSAREISSNIDPKDHISDLERFSRALALASAGHLQESTSLLKALSIALPDNSEILTSIGLNYQREGNYSIAAESFASAAKAAPMNAQAHFDLGIAYFRMQQFDQALTELHIALSIQPWYTQAEELIATIQLQKKNYLEARARFEHVLTIDPESYTAHYDLGVLGFLDRNSSQARTELRKALEIESTSSEAHNMLGSVYLQRNDLESAQEEFQSAIKFGPDSAIFHYNLSLVLRKEGKRLEEESELRKCLAIDPHIAAASAALKQLDSSSF